MDANSDDFVNDWPLTNLSTPVITLVIYFLFVLFIGPLYMKNRKPFEIRYVLFSYNLFQVILSTWNFYQNLKSKMPTWEIFTDDCKFNIINNRTASNSYTIKYGFWWFFFGKFVDLLDTVFFVLRKQTRQVTFLHLYHHFSMLLIIWYCLKHTTGEQFIIGNIFNSFVHMLMYAYYMLSAMGPKVQKYLWWKKYLTLIQMLQFTIILLYWLLMEIFNCGYGHGIQIVVSLEGLILLYLFAIFYRKSYAKTMKQSSLK